MEENSTPAPAKPIKARRRWFQFSVRTLLIVTTIIAVWLGWWSYNNGKEVRHGPQVEWNQSGGKSREIYYVQGRRHGAQTEWDSLGNKILEGSWEHDLKVGRWTRWHRPGHKASECMYKNGHIDEMETFWNDEGNLIREDRYDEAGHLREMTTWYRNGQKWRHGGFSVPKNGEVTDPAKSAPRDGIWTYWNFEGQIAAQGTWKDGRPWDGVCGIPYKQSWTNPHNGLEYFELYKDGKLIAQTVMAEKDAVDPKSGNGGGQQK